MVLFGSKVPLSSDQIVLYVAFANLISLSLSVNFSGIFLSPFVSLGPYFSGSIYFWALYFLMD